MASVDGHGGDLAVAVASRYGVTTMFTLSGAHVFPLYDAAIKADPPLAIIDVRNEQTAVFAAEAQGKLSRNPGLAVVTAGPGVTNSISALTQASMSGAPLVVIAGRAADALWGRGSLQELDHLPLLTGVTKSATTVHAVEEIPRQVAAAFAAANLPHRGPAFLDVPIDVIFATGEAELPHISVPEPVSPGEAEIDGICALLGAASRPLVILGGDVWSGGAEDAALAFVERLNLPVITNGMGRGVVPRGHRLLVTKARSTAYPGCDLAVVVGTPLDFRLAYGAFGGGADLPAAKVVHIADSPGGLATHRELDGSAAGDLAVILTAIADRLGGYPDGHAEGAGRVPGRSDRAGDDERQSDRSRWLRLLQSKARQAAAAERELMSSDAAPIHPARIYGELLHRLHPDTVVVGDGGDFVSFAGRYIEPAAPGCWLDPGPFGCLGAGLGAAIGARIARPSSHVVLLLGDGAAGMSLMDVDTLVRHDLPVVIVIGNNAAWGLEKHPMRQLYGYDVAADLAPGTRYDEVAKALGAEGELISEAEDIGPALDRALESGRPYVLNVLTDPDVAYPRATTGVF